MHKLLATLAVMMFLGVTGAQADAWSSCNVSCDHSQSRGIKNCRPLRPAPSLPGTHWNAYNGCVKQARQNGKSCRSSCYRQYAPSRSPSSNNDTEVNNFWWTYQENKETCNAPFNISGKVPLMPEIVLELMKECTVSSNKFGKLISTKFNGTYIACDSNKSFTFFRNEKDCVRYKQASSWWIIYMKENKCISSIALTKAAGFSVTPKSYLAQFPSTCFVRKADVYREMHITAVDCSKEPLAKATIMFARSRPECEKFRRFVKERIK